MAEKDKPENQPDAEKDKTEKEPDAGKGSTEKKPDGEKDKAEKKPEDERDSSAKSPRENGGDRVREHRVWVRVLLVLATILTFFAMFSVWVNRQALNTNDWVSTSSQLLEDPEIRAQLAPYLVDQLFTHVNVEARLAAALPPRAQALAGPAAAGLQQLGNKAALRLLDSPKVQQAWRNANRAAHQKLIKVINGGGKVVTTQGGDVTLNTRALVEALAQKLGIEQSKVNAVSQQLQGAKGQAAKKTLQQKTGVQLPANTGQLVILHSNHLKTVQNGAKAIRHLAVWLTILGLLLFVLAVYLARGWRRETLRTVGFCFLGLGLLVLLARTALGNKVVENLVTNESVRPAGHSVWSIGTGLLQEEAQAMAGYGIVIILAAWIAGPGRLATRIRRLLAPAMREQPGLVYGVLAIVLLLVIAWEPTRALGEFWPALLFILLVVFGVEVLRRRTIREFPEAQTAVG
jgi:hypothetical protein